MIRIRKIKTITNIKLSLLFAAAALIVGIIPASTANAAAPEDTYTWIHNLTITDSTVCAPPQSSSYCTPGAITYHNDLLYTVLVGGEILITDTSGNTVSEIMLASGIGLRQGITVDSAGNIYVSNMSDNTVQKLDSSGNVLMQVGSSGSGDGQYIIPTSLAVDAQDNLYVADQGNSRIEKFDSDGNYVSQFGSPGSGDGQFTLISGLAFDTQGNVYVGSGNRVQKFDASGNFIRSFDLSDLNADGRIFGTYDVALDAQGNIFVTDSVSVAKLSPTGQILSQFSSGGTADDQILPSSFGPSKLILDSKGYVYIADAGNVRISVWYAPLPVTPPTNPPAQPPAETLPDTGDNAVLIGLAGLGVVLIGGALFVLHVRSRRHVR